MRRERIALLVVVLGAALLGSFAAFRDAPTVVQSQPHAAPVVVAAPTMTGPAAIAAPDVAPAAPTSADGQTLTYRIAPKLRHAPQLPVLPEAPLAGWIDDYRARAEHGDADAAFVLSGALQRCVPPDAQGLRFRAELEAGALKAARDDAQRAKLAQEQAAARTAQLAFCAGVPAPSYRDAFAMLELAAQLGKLEAAFLYINQPPQFSLGWVQGVEPTQAQRDQYAAVWRRQHELALEAQAQGSEEAIFWLAWRAQTGYTADGAQDDAARDPVAAYAGFMAYQLIRSAQQRGVDYSTQQLIAELERELRPEQIDAAVLRAFAIASDPDCCLVQP